MNLSILVGSEYVPTAVDVHLSFKVFYYTARVYNLQMSICFFAFYV